MSSILTNLSALAALQTLKGVNSNLAKTQQQVSSGLRISSAKDNAAYWAIATTMRSDKSSISAIKDAIGLGQATVDTAYEGMQSVIGVLDKFNTKLVAAKEDGVDKGKIQDELNQLKQQMVSIAASSGFNGVDWLNTSLSDIYDSAQATTSLVSSFVRNSQGGVSVDKMDVDLSRLSLFNSTGGGLLQADARDVGTIGGMRILDLTQPIGGDFTSYDGVNGSSGWMAPNGNGGSAGIFALDSFPVGSPLDFNTPGAQISFDITLDKEASNPQNYGSGDTRADFENLPGPYYGGYTPPSIVITKADVDAYDPTLGGIVSTNTQFAGVLNLKLQAQGASVNASYNMYDPPGSNNWVHSPELMTITTLQQAHGFGSYVEISNLNSVGVGTGGLKEDSAFGSRGSGMALDFKTFIDATDGGNKDGIDISFDFSVNGPPTKSYSFNRTYINSVLNRNDGKVETSDDMATLMHSLLDADWPGLVIDATSPTTVIIKSDPAIDRQFGSGTSIAFNNVRVSNEPRSVFNILDIDVEQNPDLIDKYIDYMNITMSKVRAGATRLGSLQQRLDMQSNFADVLQNSLASGIGKLVDADMEQESSRLTALETQQQLALQSLQVANQNPQAILSLFSA
ncbi:flagellin [Rhizobium sp. 2YAF20]|uniref:flagellin N-terminal helical domain-containing protein n=1 Tax=Rhizobium sp. 2YAF20 TaxID=3233027 RepID=UPI003F9CBD3B